MIDWSERWYKKRLAGLSRHVATELEKDPDLAREFAERLLVNQEALEKIRALGYEFKKIEKPAADDAEKTEGKKV